MKMEGRPDDNVDSFQGPPLPVQATPPVLLLCAMNCKSCLIWKCATKVKVSLDGRSINVSRNALPVDDREVGHVQGRQSKITPLSVLVFRIDNIVPNLIRPTLFPGPLRNPDDAFTRNRRCRGGVGHAEAQTGRTRRVFDHTSCEGLRSVQHPPRSHRKAISLLHSGGTRGGESLAASLR